MDREMKLVVSTETAPGIGLPAEIAFNYEELKQRLSSYVARFDGLVVQDADIQEAKRIRAEINRVIGELTDAGRSVKKNWCSPLDVFLGRVKELVSIAKPVEESIGTQIKAHDAAKRDAKRKELAKLLAGLVEAASVGLDEECASAFTGSGHWNSCVRDELLNASCSYAKATKALEDEVKRCAEAVAVTCRMYEQRGSKWKAKAVFALARWGFDQRTAMTELDREIAEDERIARREEAERAAKERLARERAAAASAAAATPSVKPAPAPEKQEERPSAHAAPERAATPEKAAPEETVMSYVLKVTATRSKLFELRAWMDANGVRVERA